MTDPGALPRVVFIGGSGRSGSTLIERVLDQLPGACSVGETVQIWEQALARGEPCGCGLPLVTCSFWAEVGKVAFGGWDELDTGAIIAVKRSVDRTRRLPGLFLLGARQPRTPRGRRLAALADDYARPYAALYRALAEVSGSPVIIDSSKRVMLAFCLRRVPGLDLRVVHVVRDSRAVAYSWTKQITRPEADGGEAGAKTHMETYSPARTAMRWNILNLAFQLLAARGVPTLRVRYEDFTADPAGSVARMAEFACGPGGVPGELAAALSGRHAELGVTHTAAGNPLRFRTGRIDIRTDDAWRDRLPARARKLVYLLTAPLLAWYRYPRR
ncbi:MAG TPA: sulfotransferase [Streptosporangiaceae bacterium]